MANRDEGTLYIRPAEADEDGPYVAVYMGEVVRTLSRTEASAASHGFYDLDALARGRLVAPWPDANPNIKVTFEGE